MATGPGWMVDQVGVTVVVLASSLLEVVEGWWMMGGMLGEVGEGRVSLSLNTARLALSLPGSFSLLRMEDWDTPVLGAFAIRLAALGVAVCRTGLLMVGLTSAVGGFVLPAVEEVGEEGGEDITGELGEDDVDVVVAVVVEEEAAADDEVAVVVVAPAETAESAALLAWLVWQNGETVRVVTAGLPGLLTSVFFPRVDWRGATETELLSATFLYR